MIKTNSFLLILLHLSSFLSLYAEPEYDIILLAPEGKELTTTSTYESTSMNEAGYVWGGGFISFEEPGIVFEYIYHKNIGLRLISLPGNFDRDHAKITAVNCNGLAVGIYGSVGWFNQYEKQDPWDRVFIYNVHTEEYFDLLEHFGMNQTEEFSMENCFVTNLTITDTNQIVFTSRKSSDDQSFHTYIYDFNNRTASIFLKDTFLGVNGKGQMIGDSWFFEPQTGFQELGSLDKSNRWNMTPEVLNSSGIVAGTGRVSQDKYQGFTWGPEIGLKQINFPGWPHFADINDKGQGVGDFLDKSGYYIHAFIYCQDLGLMDLGSLPKGQDSLAKGINNHMQVVGKSHRAFIWDAKHGMRDLNTLIPQNKGWKVLNDAFSINDAGNIIGSGYYYDREHNFLLIPRQVGK